MMRGWLPTTGSRLLSNTLASRTQSMVNAAERLLDAAGFDNTADGETKRWSLLGPQAQLSYGVYGEMPLRAMARVLLQPTVRAVTTERSAPRFVDFGSGGGRLLLGVAAMDRWESCAGIEAVPELHGIASEAILRAEATEALPPGAVLSLHSSGLPHEVPASQEVLSKADCVFMYSTAFPSEDGLRHPELSASLATMLKESSVVVTTDAFLLGERFEFDELVPVQDAYGSPIHCFVWRVIGDPESCYDAAYAELVDQWMPSHPAERSLAPYEAMLSELEAWSASQNRRHWPGVTGPSRPPFDSRPDGTS